MLNIKVYRLKLGWTQARLADEAGLFQNQVLLMERGRLVPTIRERKLLAVVLDCPPDQLRIHVDETKAGLPNGSEYADARRAEAK